MIDKRLARNSALWLAINNIIIQLIGLLSSALMTRYLGPNEYGTLIYCVSFSAIWAFTADLGCGTIVQKEETIHTFDSATIVGSGIVLGIIGGSITFLGSLGMAIFKGEEKTILLCVGIIGGGYFLNCVYAIKYVLYARFLTKETAKNDIAMKIGSSLFRILCVLFHGTIIIFACSYLVEYLIQFVAYWRSWRKISEEKQFAISSICVRTLFKQGILNMIGSLGVVLYMNSDQFMVGSMRSEYELGMYSIAVGVSSMAQFLISAFSTSMFSYLLGLKKEDSDSFDKEYTEFFEKMFLLALIIVIGTLVVGKLFIYVVYGKEYLDSYGILIIYVFSQFFVAMGCAESVFTYAYDLQKEGMYITIIAGVMNVMLNLLFIMRLGTVGAAFATLIAMFVQVFGRIMIFAGYKPLMRYFILMLNFTWTRRMIGKTISGFKR